MNTDQEGMDTDGRGCFAMQLGIRVHPWISVFIIFKPYGFAAGTRLVSFSWMKL
jgi:hypothetical protein